MPTKKPAPPAAGAKGKKKSNRKNHSDSSSEQSSGEDDAPSPKFGLPDKDSPGGSSGYIADADSSQLDVDQHQGKKNSSDKAGVNSGVPKKVPVPPPPPAKAAKGKAKPEPKPKPEKAPKPPKGGAKSKGKKGSKVTDPPPPATTATTLAEKKPTSNISTDQPTANEVNPVQSETVEESTDTKNLNPENELCISNLADEVKETDIRGLFSHCDNVKVELQTVAYVRFNTSNEALQGLKMRNKMKLYGRELRISNIVPPNLVPLTETPPPLDICQLLETHHPLEIPVLPETPKPETPTAGTDIKIPFSSKNQSSNKQTVKRFGGELNSNNKKEKKTNSKSPSPSKSKFRDGASVSSVSVPSTRATSAASSRKSTARSYSTYDGNVSGRSSATQMPDQEDKGTNFNVEQDLWNVYGEDIE